MKFRIPHFIILSSIYLFAAGCKSYLPLPHFATTTITKSNEEPCLFKSTEVKIVPANEKVKFDYDQIGIIEFYSNYDAHEQAKIDYLKYEAWKNCADAVIHISSDYQYGMAVKIIKNKKIYSNYQSQTDTSFITYVKMDQEYLQNTHPQNKGTNSDEVNAGINVILYTFVIGFVLFPFIVAETADN